MYVIKTIRMTYASIKLDQIWIFDRYWLEMAILTRNGLKWCFFFFCQKWHFHDRASQAFHGLYGVSLWCRRCRRRRCPRRMDFSEWFLSLMCFAQDYYLLKHWKLAFSFSSLLFVNPILLMQDVDCRREKEDLIRSSLLFSSSLFGVIC